MQSAHSSSDDIIRALFEQELDVRSRLNRTVPELAAAGPEETVSVPVATLHRLLVTGRALAKELRTVQPGQTAEQLEADAMAHWMRARGSRRLN